MKLSRRATVFGLVALGLPVRARAGFSIGFDVVSAGPVSVGVSVPISGIVAAGIAVGAFLYGVFSSLFGGRRRVRSWDSGSYSAGAPSTAAPTPPPKPDAVLFSMEIPADAVLSGAVIEKRYFDLFDSQGRLGLSEDAYLQIPAGSGTNVTLVSPRSRGYLHILNDRRTLLGFSPDGELLVTVSRQTRDSELLVFRHESDAGLAMASELFPGLPDANS